MSPRFLISPDKPLRILFVEDNELNSFYISKVVAGLEDKIDMVENGLLAVNKVSQNLYDIVFMDIHMPVMNGLEAIRQIRKLPAPYGTVPIIGMTHAEIDDGSKYEANSGMNEFIDKTFSLEELRAVVAKWTKKQENTEQGNGEKAHLKQMVYDENSPILKMKNPETRNKMIQVFNDQLSEFYHKMDLAIEKSDWEEIYFLVHKMKSSAEVIGITAVKEELDKMEKNFDSKLLNDLKKNYSEMKQLLNGYSTPSS